MEKIISYFLVNDRQKDEVFVDQERTLVIFLLSTLILNLIVIPVYFYLEISILLNLLYIASIVSTSLLFYLKYTAKINRTSFLFILYCLVHFFLNIIYTGGIHSSLVIWLTLIPILAIILSNGLISYTVIGLSVILIGLMTFDFLGIEFQNALDSDLQLYFGFFNRINFMGVIILIVFNFDRGKRAVNQELKKSNTELEQFAYIASHDMKAPLRNIISFTQILQRKIKGKIEPKDEIYIDHILNNGYQMNELIQGILDLAKIEKQETLVLKMTDLNETLNKVKVNISSELEHKNVILEVETLPTISVNEPQIIQLFQNLIENGIKYNRSEIPKIKITHQHDSKMLHIYVKDNGIGISPQYFDKIFEMFKRLHSGYEFTGTGIGLAICKTITLRHKGNLVVEESSDKGTTFKVSLPLQLFTNESQNHFPL